MTKVMKLVGDIRNPPSPLTSKKVKNRRNTVSFSSPRFGRTDSGRTKASCPLLEIDPAECISDVDVKRVLDFPESSEHRNVVILNCDEDASTQKETADMEQTQEPKDCSSTSSGHLNPECLELSETMPTVLINAEHVLYCTVPRIHGNCAGSVTNCQPAVDLHVLSAVPCNHSKVKVFEHRQILATCAERIDKVQPDLHGSNYASPARESLENRLSSLKTWEKNLDDMRHDLSKALQVTSKNPIRMTIDEAITPVRGSPDLLRVCDLQLLKSSWKELEYELVQQRARNHALMEELLEIKSNYRNNLLSIQHEMRGFMTVHQGKLNDISNCAIDFGAKLCTIISQPTEIQIFGKNGSGILQGHTSSKQKIQTLASTRTSFLDPGRDSNCVIPLVSPFLLSSNLALMRDQDMSETEGGPEKLRIVLNSYQSQLQELQSSLKQQNKEVSELKFELQKCRKSLITCQAKETLAWQRDLDQIVCKIEIQMSLFSKIQQHVQSQQAWHRSKIFHLRSMKLENEDEISAQNDVLEKQRCRLMLTRQESDQAQICSHELSCQLQGLISVVESHADYVQDVLIQLASGLEQVGFNNENMRQDGFYLEDVLSQQPGQLDLSKKSSQKSKDDQISVLKSVLYEQRHCLDKMNHELDESRQCSHELGIQLRRAFNMIDLHLDTLHLMHFQKVEWGAGYAALMLDWPPAELRV